MADQSNLLQLKKLAAKMTGKTVDKIGGTTLADVLDIIGQNYTNGGGGSVGIASVELYANSEFGIHGGVITLTNGSNIDITVNQIDKLTLKAVEGSATGKTKITVTEPLGSGNHYRFKINAEFTPAKGELLTTWTEWNGIDDITAQNGTDVFIAECDSEFKAVKCGVCDAVAPIF